MRLAEINAYNCPEPPLDPPDCWEEERATLDEEGD